MLTIIPILQYKTLRWEIKEIRIYVRPSGHPVTKFNPEKAENRRTVMEVLPSLENSHKAYVLITVSDESRHV